MEVLLKMYNEWLKEKHDEMFSFGKRKNDVQADIRYLLTLK